MFGFIFTLLFGISDEMNIRREIKKAQPELERRCAEFRERMQKWEELSKKDYRKDLF